MPLEQALKEGLKYRVHCDPDDFDRGSNGCTMCYEYSHNGSDWTTDWQEAYELLKK